MPDPLLRHHRFAQLVAGCTFLLIVAGGLVTSTGSGLAVPDWPLSFGQVFPRMEGGVLFEHGHRMVASAVGLLIVVLAAWTHLAEPRGWVRQLGWALLGAVVLQGVLGGLTVLMRLPDVVSVAHAGLAQLVFSATVLMAAVTAPGFRLVAPRGERGAELTRLAALIACVATFAQIVLGAIVRHIGAGLAIPDFPLNYGRIIPPFDAAPIAWQFAHRLGAVAATGCIAWSAWRVLRLHRGDAWLRFPVQLLLALTATQILLGGMTIWLRRDVVPTTAHQSVGALVLALMALVAIRVHHALRPVGAA